MTDLLGRKLAREGKERRKQGQLQLLLCYCPADWVGWKRLEREETSRDGVCECGAKLDSAGLSNQLASPPAENDGGEAHRLSVLVQKGATGSHEMPRIGDAPTTLQVAVWVVKFCESCDARER